MRRAFRERFRHVIVETDNHEAFQIIRNFSNDAPTAYYHIYSQIDVLLNNNSWVCSINFIFPACNRVGCFAARFGMEVCDHLYTLDHPIGGSGDLVEWNLGLGFDHPNFQDIVIPNHAHDPVNFNVDVGLAGQIHELGYV